ncbi:MATE efflux family protein [Xylona heveae TC161]|uniref:MATE efflux family protein n=1 Tax=Xylona heveae (strain CBS 132557 / TC161) TaxID=1328760 RepID=A0A164ZCJ5_XYLHT|nr:MATE efflux family protein [Xylona heveae TC161]KZF18936.1 MATE efflux family protein [Xylona heveae TC161]
MTSVPQSKQNQWKARSQSISSSFQSAVGSWKFSALAAEAAELIRKDLERESILDHENEVRDEEEEEETINDSAVNDDLEPSSSYLDSEHALTAGAYHPPSLVSGGPRALFIPTGSLPALSSALTASEQEDITNEERVLLRDNNIIPGKRPAEEEGAAGKALSLFTRPLDYLKKGVAPAVHEEHAGRITERSRLLGTSEQQQYTKDSPEHISRKWEEAVSAGLIQTTWQRETKVIVKYSRSLIATFVLQYSLTAASILVVGHLGKNELGAASLAITVTNVTGYAIYQGLSTSLDTLCAQAYGSGKRTLVGLQLQRMLLFLWALTIPIAVVWLCGTFILQAIIPDKEVARLAGYYLKVVLAGAPGYAAFEAGKRFMQAQGLFSATFYVLLIGAPLNILLSWLLVWELGLGFVGSPIAVAVTQCLLPIGLFLYVRFVRGMECWGGWDRRAWQNWRPMIKLAIPGLAMVLAEFLAFGLLTLSSSWISATHLAAQSILNTVVTITWQIPFPISVVVSTRIANLIGAALPDAAKVTRRVALSAALLVGGLNSILLGTLSHYIPWLFTADPDVALLVTKVLPVCAAYQIFDALTASCNGILRGLGKQKIGGWVCLFCYYVIGIPISFGTGFGLHWFLYGFWAGPAIALALVAALEGIFLFRTDWDVAVSEAQNRNELD